MGSVKCKRCGMVCWSGAEACTGCNQSLFESRQRGYDDGYAAAAGGNAKKRAGLAVASLVIGIISLPTLGILGVGALAGITLGVVALVRAKREPATYGGQGLAIGGIVASALSLMLAVPIGIIAAIAIPNLLAARRAANEGSAIYHLRLLAEAERHFQATTGSGAFGNMADLERENLIEAELARGFKHGYFFKVTPYGESFEVSASPMRYPQDGARSFYFSSADSVIRAADKGGLEADAEDPPLPEFRSRRGGAHPGSHSPSDFVVSPDTYAAPAASR